jgi:hypothetical protein
MRKVLRVGRNGKVQEGGTCPGFVERLRLGATASERSSRCRGANPLTPGNSGRRQRELVRSSGRPIAQIARELGIAHGTLSAWVKQAELDAGLRSDGLVTAEREELRRLRRENRILREEREIRTLPMKSVGLHGGPWGKRLPSSLGRPSPSRRGVWLRGAGEG